jgi:hypothetical protein
MAVPFFVVFCTIILPVTSFFLVHMYYPYMPSVLQMMTRLIIAVIISFAVEVACALLCLIP